MPMPAPTALSPDVRAVLLAMAYLLVKHFVADFLLQTEAQRREKGTYGALGGLTHCLTHIVLTAPVFYILPSISPALILAFLTGEFLIHYHLDWLKEQAVHRHGWTSHDTAFWWALGADQLMHGLTYVAIVWLTYLSTAAGIANP